MYVAKLITRLYLMALVMLTTPSQGHATGAPMIINEVAFKKLPGQTGLGVWLPESTRPDSSAINQIQRDLLAVQQLITMHFSLDDISVILMPHNSRAKADFVIHSPTTLHYHFNPARKNRDFRQMVTSALYRAKRQQFDNSDSAFNQLVSTGLALHFVEAVMDPKVLFQPKARGYQLVARHFAQYPGSHAGNTYALDNQLFEQHLTTLEPLSHKPHQYIRTDTPPAQQARKDFDWQGTKHKGMVFLEGWNRQKHIALTFDDGPWVHTQQILDILEQYKIKASFFWMGSSLQDNQPLVLRAKNAGHTIANHSWNHPNGPSLSAQELWLSEIDKTNEAIKDTTGNSPRFYRPPFGQITTEQIDYLRGKGMKVMLWSIDTKDWDTSNASARGIETTVNDNMHPEGISLMHDGGGDRQASVDALPGIIEHYQAQGYQFVNLETLVGISDKF